MNLLINAEALRPPITGIGNYTFHLLEQLVGLELVDDVQCFTGTAWQDARAQLAVSAQVRNTSPAEDTPASARVVSRLREWIGRVPGTKPAYDALMDRRFKRHANAVPQALYHETNYILKPFSGRSLTTVHDLSHLRFPEYHPAHVVERLNRLLPESLARAEIVVTVSDLVRDELLDYFPLSPDKVVTVYEGVDARYRPHTAPEAAPVLDRYGLRYGAYVLMVATLEPRKGIDTLLDAWEALPLAQRRECPLVLTGSTGWRNESLRERIAVHTQQQTVKHLGYVPSDDLPALFAGARVFSYPSVYEGFGLPVLDAMASGVPVVCRAGTSMAEFAQGACVLCETGSAQELASHLGMLMEDDEAQSAWGRRGLAQARYYSWERCARETADLYRRLI